MSPLSFHIAPYSQCLSLSFWYYFKYVQVYCRSSLYSSNKPLEEIVNIIFLIKNFNSCSHKYLKDDYPCIFIRVKVLFGVSVLNKHLSQQVRLTNIEENYNVLPAKFSLLSNFSSVSYGSNYSL